jgi:hypothetical protein
VRELLLNLPSPGYEEFINLHGPTVVAQKKGNEWHVFSWNFLFIKGTKIESNILSKGIWSILDLDGKWKLFHGDFMRASGDSVYVFSDFHFGKFEDGIHTIYKKNEDGRFVVIASGPPNSIVFDEHRMVEFYEFHRYGGEVLGKWSLVHDGKVVHQVNGTPNRIPFMSYDLDRYSVFKNRELWTLVHDGVDVASSRKYVHSKDLETYAWFSDLDCREKFKIAPTFYDPMEARAAGYRHVVVVKNGNWAWRDLAGEWHFVIHGKQAAARNIDYDGSSFSRNGIDL